MLAVQQPGMHRASVVTITYKVVAGRRWRWTCIDLRRRRPAALFPWPSSCTGHE
jgi:hypothetical protein